MTKSYTAENKFIISKISWDGYTTEKEPETDKEKLQFLHDCFTAEYGWHVKRWGIQKGLHE